MKKILLLTFLVNALTSFSQNQAPVAVDDTLIISYDQISYGEIGDTNIENFNSFLQNDYDPNGDYISIDSTFILGSSSNFVTGLPGNGWWYIIAYNSIIGFSGLDSIRYIIKDDGNPVMYDTGTIYITVREPIHEMLDANNIRARIDIHSVFGSLVRPGYEAPAGSGLSTIFASNLWVGGKLNNTVYSSVKTFGFRNNTGTVDYGSSNTGPVSNSSAQYVQYNDTWDKVWKVYQHQIDFHMNNWNDPGYTLIQNIADWPAHGDTVLGEAFYLAPFYDHNNDGLYNPMSGDYPIIKGDQAIYFIYNDGGSSYSLNPMLSEVHGMAYAYQCMDSALRNTIFVDYKIYNRSNNTYDSTYFGMWSDMDLGNAEDDYVQCDVDRGLFYTFNGDDFDDDSQGRPSYGSHPPAQAVMILQGAKQDDDGVDNNFGIQTNESINGIGFGDGITDNEHWGMERYHYYNNAGQSVTGDPQTDIEFYNYLSGYWRDGEPVVHGGQGYPNTPGATTIPTKYMFPGLSDTYNYGTGGVALPTWTEFTAFNMPADRRGMGSTGPVTFAPGDAIELTYAFVFGRDYVNTGAQAGVINMLMRSDSIRSYYNQGMLAPCGNPVSVNKLEEAKSTIKVFPNPVDNVVNIRQQSASQITITIIDATGKVMRTTTSNSLITTINLQGLANGLYVIKVSNADGVEFKKMIKR